MNASPSGLVATSPTRQLLTLLFTDLSGSKALGRVLEPEEYAELIEGIRNIWRVVTERFGGHVVRAQGDGALILFGFPRLTEDDGRRAVEAALEIHRNVSRMVIQGLPSAFTPLTMHSGVHAGLVLLSPGDMERGRFDLTGEVVNTAAHLSDLASSGQILVSTLALGPHDNFFEHRAQLPAEPQAPVDARIVLGRRSGVQRRFDATSRRGLTPFVGRSEFVARIESFLLQGYARPGAPQQRCMVVVGGAGMGKTRLFAEIFDSLDLGAAVVLRAWCETDTGAEVLQPFAQMVRSFFGVSARTRLTDLGADVLAALRPWQERMGASADTLLRFIASDGEAPGNRHSTGGVVGDLLAFFLALCGQREVVMLIDDWQWADDASLQLLGALLAAKNQLRVILATRPSESGEIEIQDAQHVRLTPLDESDTRQAIRRWLPYANPFLCKQIHDYSGGSPLFIEELCHSASAGSLQRAIEGREAAKNWLASLAVTRLERLPPTLADSVRVASVIGNEAPLWLLEAITGQGCDAATLSALAEADFLYPMDSADALRFKHGLTRDAVYQSIGLARRTALHERVLSALLKRSNGSEPGDAIEALAHHSRGAGNWGQAAEFAERAGDKATLAFATDRARVQYEQAMHALDRSGQRSAEQSLRWCLLANKLGMTCIFDPLTLGDDPSVFERAVSRAQELGDANVVARAKYWLAYICYGLGRFRESLRHAREALDLAVQAGDSRLEAQIKATLGQVLAATCDYESAINLIDVAIDAKRQRSRPRGGLAIGSAYALACKGGALADRGDFSAAHACFDEAMDLLAGSTHPVGNSVRNWIAVAHNWQGSWSNASKVAADSVRIAEHTRALLLLSAARSSGGYAAWASEGSSTGLEQLAEAMRWMDERQGRFFTSIYFGWLAAATVTEGRMQEARAHAVKVFQRARHGERLGEAVAARSLAWAATLVNDQGAAQRWMRRAEVAAHRRGSAREVALNQLMHGQLQMHLGRPGPARLALDNAASAFESMQMLWHRQAAGAQADAMAVGRPIFT